MSEACGIRDFIDEWVDAWNAHDARVIANCYAEDAEYVRPSLPDPLWGRDEIERHVAAFFQAFPDWRIRIGTCVRDGRTVACVLRYAGTNRNTAPLRDFQISPGHPLPGSGAHVRLEAASFLTFDGTGRILRDCVYYDRQDLAHQLGAPRPPLA